MASQCVVCLGCGENMAGKTSNKKDLNTDSATEVFLLSKELYFDRVLSPDKFDELATTHKMCRMCFSGMSRFISLRNKIEGNLAVAFEALDDLLEEGTATTATMASTSFDRQLFPCAKRPAFSSDSSTPHKINFETPKWQMCSCKYICSSCKIMLRGDNCMSFRFLSLASAHTY